jgi:hypothetical protein
METADNFYDEGLKNDPTYGQELDEVDEELSLEEMLANVTEDEPVDVGEEREDWNLTLEEEKLLNTLLKKKEKEDHILKTFLSLENKPTQEHIDKWKVQFGDVYLVSLSEKENFVFRPLKRQEWKQLLAAIVKLPEVKKTDAIAMKGVVWPKLTDASVGALTAGATETLRALILEASNFIEPERAIQLVRKL